VGELLLATSVDWFYMSSPGRDSNLKTYANGDAFMWRHVLVLVSDRRNV